MAAVVLVPQVFGDDERAALVAGLLHAAQQKLAELRAQQQLNVEDDDAQILGQGDDAPTYGERCKQIEDGCVLLMEQNEDVREQVETLAKKWSAEREAQRKEANPK
jgi:hypothetical protein